MAGTLEKAWGYHGDAMNLPVRDVAGALPFYEAVLGFRVVSRTETPPKSAVLARDMVQIRLAENGGDPTQDGCAFHVQDLDARCSPSSKPADCRRSGPSLPRASWPGPSRQEPDSR
jgi:catechol 2,3-dioxygenase-like lactoylglutathione lyase family enzyme